MKSVFDAANPSAHPDDAKEVFDKVFAELDKAADKIKIRQFAIDNRHAMGMDSVAANVNEAERLVALIKKGGLSTNDVLALLDAQIKACADTPRGRPHERSGRAQAVTARKKWLGFDLPSTKETIRVDGGTLLG